MQGFPHSSVGKESACNAGDLGSIPGLRRFPGGGNGNPVQYSCLENPRDGGAWWAAVYGLTQSWTQLKRLSSSSSMLTSWVHWASLVAQKVKCLSAMQETWVRFLGWEDPLEKETAAHSSTLA